MGFNPAVWTGPDFCVLLNLAFCNMTDSLAEKIKNLHNLESEDPVVDSNGSTETSSPQDTPKPQQANGNGKLASGIPLAELLAKGKLPSLPRKTPAANTNGSPANTPPPVRGNLMGARSREAETTARVELPAIDKQQAAKTITEIQKLGVSIEISKGYSNISTVLLKGPASAVEKARQLVGRQLAPRVTVELVIPASARSAVIGTRGSTLKNIIASTDTKINIENIAQPREGWSLPLVTVEITGSVTGVQEAEKMITDLVNNSLLMDERDIPENLKLFIAKYVADRGLEAETLNSAIRLSAKFSELQAAQKEIDQYLAQCASEYAFKELAVDAIGILPSDLVFSDHNVAIVDDKLYGPADKLEAAAKALEQYTKAMELIELDISKAHNRDVEHAARLAEFLELSGAIAELEEAHKVRVTRSENDLVFQIAGFDKAKLQEVKRALVQVVNQRTPPSLLALSGIESEFGRSQAQTLAESLTGDKKDPVRAYLVDDGRVLIGYDFATVDEDDFGPTGEECASAVSEAAALFEAISQREATLVTKQVPMSKADFRHLINPVGSARERVDELVGKGKLPKVDLTYDGSAMVLTGAEEDVAAVLAAWPEIIAESKREHELTNYTETVQFTPELLKNLVGRNGANISKLREKFKCKIDARAEGEVVVRGREADVREAVKEINAYHKELKNRRVEELTIPRQYHAILIGSKGRFVRRMQDKYNVRVQFPSRYDTPGSSSEDGTASVASSDQGNDIIILSGPADGVAATKKEFEDLVAYEKSHSYTREFEFPSEHAPRLIGRRGAFINQLSATHSVNIDVKREETIAKLVVTGAKRDVDLAVKEAQDEVSRLADQVEKVLVVDPKYHRYLTGPSNAIRNQIVAEAGGDAENAARVLHIPVSTSGSKEIRITGPLKVAEAIATKIQAIVDDEQARHKYKISVSVPANQVRYVIGPGGAAKREIESEFGVTVEVPNTKAATVQVTIRGRSQESVDNAKERVLSLVNLGQLEILIPAYLEGDVFNRGQLASQLESEFGVRLTTPKRPGNPRSAPKAPESGNAAGDAPFFTTTTFSSAGGDQNVKWTLSGKNEEACKKAGELVQAAIDKQAKHDTAGYLWLPSRTPYSKIIGPGGNSINEVRSKSGCQIVVPKQGRDNEPVSIRGPSKDVELARQLLLALADLE